MSPFSTSVHREIVGGGPRILVNSLPKSGTHLVASILALFPGLAPQKPVLTRKLRWHPVNYLHPWDRRTCLVGIGQPREIRLATMYYLLDRLHQGHYLLAHIPYQECVAEMLQSMGIRTIFVIRDPRDVVVSQVHYVLKHSAHYLHSDYKKLPTDKERFIAAILGVIRREGNYKSYGIARKLEITSGWREAESVLNLRFEDLVGERGGGSLGDQRRAIMQIGSHVGIEVSAQEARSIGEAAFGRGYTYRRGRIGSWRDVFDEEVKDIFKRAAGDYLLKTGYEANDSW